jgi:hypothetical protein
MKSLQMLRSAKTTKIEKNTAIMLLARLLQRIQINLIANPRYAKFTGKPISSFRPCRRRSGSNATLKLSKATADPSLRSG